MAYSIENRDLVIRGFENGIGISPESGLGDMRNCDIISIPGECAVSFGTQASTILQASITGAVFTASGPSILVLTWAGGTTLPNGTAVTVANSGGALPTGLSGTTAYYVVNATSTTFELATQYNGSPISYTDAGSGTNTFTCVTMAKPKYSTSAFLVHAGTLSPIYIYMLQDGNGRVWVYYNSTWVYANNFKGNEGAAGSTELGNGIAIWENYCFSFRQEQISSAPITYTDDNTAFDMTKFSATSNWHYTQQLTNQEGDENIDDTWPTTGYAAGVSHEALVGKTDGVLYFCNINGLGSLSLVAGKTFDPSDSTTYTLNTQAVAFPTYEIAQCIGQLGTNIVAGGLQNVVYNWDRVSIGYLPIFLAENGVYKIVGANTNAFLFAGQRGRIYVTSGYYAEYYTKLPDHLSGTIDPYYTWGGAVYSRNQIYFGAQATNNAGTAINQYGGLWAIDLDLGQKSLRLVNQMSYGDYSGIVSTILTLLGPTTSDGFGLLMGWYTTVGGVDKGLSTPYTGGQAYVDSDLIPVGTFLKPFTGSQVEWKTSAPLVSGESIALYYRTNITDAYTLIPRTNTDSLVGAVSDNLKVNFEKAQWLQLRAVLTSTATNPSYCRLTELRIRDFPSQ